MVATRAAERGRAAYASQRWGEAYTALSEAMNQTPRYAEDLERLAVAAYLSGRGDAATNALEQAHVAFRDAGEVSRSVRCAFWLGLLLIQSGQNAQGGGWLARAQRDLDRADLNCVERGYLLIPPALQALMHRDAATALTGFEQAAAVADRFDDPDLVAMSRLGQGQALVELDEAARGTTMLDEAMVAVISGEVSPILAGIVYCSVILSCRKIFDLRRAQEWTAALSRWCEAQQDLQPYRGQCLIHRSEILQLGGDWQAAIDEVEDACVHLSRAPHDPVMGMAQYQLGELHRCRGAFRQAEECYRQASRWGHPVQPGLALLRLAQGKFDEAAAAIRRVAQEEHDRVRRSRVLAAYVDIMLAVADIEAARKAAEELTTISDTFASAYLRAVASYARGAVLLAEGDPAGCCGELRGTTTAWQDLDVPYEMARTQALLAQACQRLGDRDTADIELAAARQAFEQLGAAPALAKVRALTDSAPTELPGGLTHREAEVLRLIARGLTNRQIAEELVISEKTVARHVSNIFTKLDISSRTAATAFAYVHGLVEGPAPRP
jgi:DNA-binding CsgD family transcriptional regulator